MAISATATKKETQFLWEGKDKRGHKVRGKSLAPNEAALRADLRRQGVAATRVKTQSNTFRSGGKITDGDIAVFSRQLATMMSAGIPMVQAFEIIGNGHEKPAMQKLVLDVKANIEGGSTLHESLAKFPLYFDALFVNLVEAGEQAGALETLLDKIATYKEKTEALKKKIKKAMFYPMAVLAVAVIVSIILLIFVIPQFESLFKGFGASLPAFTQMVVDLSRFVQHQGWWLACVIGGSFYAFFFFKKRSRPMQLALDLPLHAADPCYILNPMVQFKRAHLDASFAALSDATRRGILERLGRADASITDLAGKFHMTLTGVKKHVGVLEQAGLVTTEKVGRVRTCKLGLRRLEEEAAWIERYRQLWDARFDELDKIVESLKREERVDGRKKRK